MNFKSFVVLAEMRTGSNFLEANLNAYDGLACHGEAFNPAFVGYPHQDAVLGFSRELRDADPKKLLKALRAEPGMNGFRYFSDHDPRVRDVILDDPKCAKVILTRNPLDSYLSLKIARQTGQWKLTNVKRAKTSKAEFDAREFQAYLDELHRAQLDLKKRLQHSGQTAFYISYDDINDIDTLNGLVRWLGVEAQRDGLDRSLKPQNPFPAEEKVENPDEMKAAIAQVDFFNLSNVPSLEPKRGPVVPSYIASEAAPLLYQPIQGGPVAALRDWLGQGGLVEGFTQSSLRKWLRQNKAARSFTVVRHPLARAHACFCEMILPEDGEGYLDVREELRRQYGVPLKAHADAPGYDHKAAFSAFLVFLKRNLAGQTSLRIDPWWASQTSVLEGFSHMRTPDLVIREAELDQWLAPLAEQLGLSWAQMETDPWAEKLREIYDPELDRLAQAAYRHDYINLGYGRYEA